MAQANVKLIVDASNAQKALRGVQKQTNQLHNSFGGLKTAIAGIGFTLLAKQTISTTSNFQALQIRMKVLTSEFGEFAGAQDLVRKAQDKFNLSIVEATKGITDIFARLRPLGVTLKEIETVFFGFNTIAKQAGLNATEASAAFTQLAQGLGSGRLQGDEFRSIAEQVPQLLKAISDETGIATGKLKDFASKGLLTSDIILRALAKSADEGADQIKKIMEESPAETFKEFSNAALELQLTLGSKLLPATLEVTKALTKLVNGITRFIDSEAGQVTLAFVGIAAAIKTVTVIAPILLGQIAALKANFLAMSMASAAANGSLATTTTMAFATAGGFTKAAAAATAFKLALAKTGIGLAVIALGTFITKLLEANNAQRTFNELLEQGSALALKKEIEDLEKEQKNLNTQLENTNRLLMGILGFAGLDIFTRSAQDIKLELAEVNNKIAKLKEGLPNAEARDLAKQFELQLDKLKKQNAELTKAVKRDQIKNEEKKKEFDLEQKIAAIKEKFSGEEAERLISLAKQNHELGKQRDKIQAADDAAKRLAETYKKIGDSIATGISDALTDAVMGTKTLADAAKNLLNDIATMLVRTGINTLLFNTFGGSKGIFKNLDTFAAGGRPTVGQPAIVGEKGPELFVPSSAGTIIPNNQLGRGGLTNNIVINVDANGGVVAQGGEEQGRELGRLIAVAVQSEIIQQKRAGGLLA